MFVSDLCYYSERYTLELTEVRMPQYFLFSVRLNGTGAFRFPDRCGADTGGASQ